MAGFWIFLISFRGVLVPQTPGYLSEQRPRHTCRLGPLGFPTTHTQRVHVGPKWIEVHRLRITKAGRQTVADRRERVGGEVLAHDVLSAGLAFGAAIVDQRGWGLPRLPIAIRRRHPAQSAREREGFPQFPQFARLGVSPAIVRSAAEPSARIWNARLPNVSLGARARVRTARDWSGVFALVR